MVALLLAALLPAPLWAKAPSPAAAFAESARAGARGETGWAGAELALWADKLVFPLWLQAQDLASADGRERVSAADVDYAATVQLKVSIERREGTPALRLHHYMDAVLEAGARPPSYAPDWAAAAAAYDRHAQSLSMGLDEDAAWRLIDLSNALRAGLQSSRLPLEGFLAAVLADATYFGFKPEGVEAGPTIAARARANSLRFLRPRAAGAHAAVPAALEAVKAAWLKAQASAQPTQFLLTGAQVRAAIDSTYAGLAASAKDPGPLASRRDAWAAVLAAAEESRPARRGDGGALWAAVDPYAATELAELAAIAADAGGLAPKAPPAQASKLKERQFFVDVTADSGVRFDSQDPLDRISVGFAWLDFDRDGRTDFYVRVGRHGGRLYRNAGGFKFKDATAAAGLAGVSSERSVSADFDNDGWPDLLLLGADGGRRTRLFRNDRGRFVDVTEKSGIGAVKELSVAAVWLDYDLDGRLDLYVVNAGRYYEGVTAAGGPSLNGSPNRLYRNNGDGTFAEVGEAAGVADSAWGWAAAAFDYDGDRLPDLFVCNVFGRSRLYRNKGDGAFEDATAGSGIDLPSLCKGVSVGDVNHDWRPDLLVGAVGLPQDRLALLTRDAAAEESFEPGAFAAGYATPPSMIGDSVFLNMGAGRFERAYGVDASSRTGFSWNGFFFDFNLDGHQDVFLINGFYPDTLFYHDESKALYAFQPYYRRFAPMPAGHGAEVPGVSRGSAFSDLNGDGCPDLAVTGLHGLRLLRNACDFAGRHWLRLELEGVRSNRDGIGARVRVQAGDTTQVFDYGSRGGGSVSSFDGGLLVGLGESAAVDSIEVRWPSGALQLVSGAAADRTLRLREPAQEAAP